VETNRPTKKVKSKKRGRRLNQSANVSDAPIIPGAQVFDFRYEGKPIDVVVPEDQYIDYADSFMVAYTNEEFILSFLQLQHPILATQEQLDGLEALESVCLARISLTPNRYLALMYALQVNFQRYVAEHGDAVLAFAQQLAQAKSSQQK
jgi:hypothetical protein